MFKVKEILCDIVDVAYKNSEKLDRYKRFYVEIKKENSKTKHGSYDLQKHKIDIYNTYRDDEAIICTTIHELAHHIDNMNRRTSDHQKEFYVVYRKLLFAALDMGIVSKTAFLKTAKDASDSNKIRKIMDEYFPHPVEYKQEKKIISVINGFEIKDRLKEAGFYYNSNARTWDKETDDISYEKGFLDSLGAEYDILEAKKMSFTGSLKLIAGQGSFEQKENLKEAGFRWDKTACKKGAWVFRTDKPDEINAMTRKFPSIKFQRI